MTVLPVWHIDEEMGTNVSVNHAELIEKQVWLNVTVMVMTTLANVQHARRQKKQV